MEFISHLVGGARIAEVQSQRIEFTDAQSALEAMMNAYYQGFDRLIVHQHNVAPEFFDLRTGLAGDILQKFSTYQVRLAIVGDFSRFESKALRDFIYESNNGGRINFVDSLEAALKRLSI